MDNPTALKLEYQNAIINKLHTFIANNFPEGTILFSQLFIKVIIVLVIFLLLDLFQRKILLRIVLKIIPQTNNIWMNTFLKKQVFTSFFHLLPLGICYLLVPMIFYHHPQSFHFLDLVFSIFLSAFIAKFIINLINAYTDVRNRDKSYRTVAVKTFSELIKIIIVVFTGFIIISILFDLSSSKIFTFVGAIMAVILLVFKDPILGFVAGINIANSKQIKVGDRISIPKYQIDGNILEINLITTKILNLDKTTSSIPTYDLISTDVRNYESMIHSHTKRIKRSITFNPKSFKFIDDKFIDKLVSINFLSDNFIKHNIRKEDFLSKKLTNMEVFRNYIKIYLKENSEISQTDTLLVKLLEPTIYGVPLEIYCFTSTSISETYEDIQSNIFEHIITTCYFFDLELVSVTPS